MFVIICCIVGFIYGLLISFMSDKFELTNNQDILLRLMCIFSVLIGYGLSMVNNSDSMFTVLME